VDAVFNQSSLLWIMFDLTVIKQNKAFVPNIRRSTDEIHFVFDMESYLKKEKQTISLYP